MNSVQTVTVNSALNQNWVGCTVRTPKAQAARTLRAQCPGHGRYCAHSRQVVRMSRAQPAQVARMSRAQPVQVARIGPRSWAQVATSFPCPAPGQVATSFPGRDLLEANPCRDIKFVSRHHSGHFRSRPQNGVATPFLLPSLKPGRDTRTMSRPSWRLPYVATSISCRDFVSQQSRSRRQFHVVTSWRLTYVATSNLCRDLRYCRPCRDIKSMSRRRFCPQWDF